MALSRKHFEQFANIVRTALVRADDMRDHGDTAAAEVIEREAWHLMIELADMSQKENPNFNTFRFAEACGFRWAMNRVERV